MARETQLWDSLSKARFVLRDDLHMHRVENIVSPGAPDVEGHYKFTSAFQFELKSEARPVRPETPIHFKMRPKQVEYARRRWLVGGAIFWLLQVGEGSSRRVYMIEGIHGAKINAGLTEVQLHALDILRQPKFDPAECVKMAFR